MCQNLKLHFEKLFRELSSPDELFDAFKNALENKINDIELYKIFLGNIALSPYEVRMFTEKLCNEFKDLSFDLYMWSASILENCNARNCVEMSFEYYRKAAEADSFSHLPYFSIVKLYNPEIDIPPQKELFQILQNSLEKVKYKSKIYLAMAELYGKLDNLTLKQKYTALAAKLAQYER